MAGLVEADACIEGKFGTDARGVLVDGYRDDVLLSFVLDEHLIFNRSGLFPFSSLSLRDVMR